MRSTRVSVVEILPASRYQFLALLWYRVPHERKEVNKNSSHSVIMVHCSIAISSSSMMSSIFHEASLFAGRSPYEAPQHGGGMARSGKIWLPVQLSTGGRYRARVSTQFCLEGPVENNCKMPWMYKRLLFVNTRLLNMILLTRSVIPISTLSLLY